MATVTYEKATRTYPGSDTPAVDKLDLEINDGEFMVLVGPSGCGKSTSLRMLAGLEEINEGAVKIGDRDVTHLPPKDRDIAMVFQNYALYPHMSVAENMAFALKMQGVPKDQRLEKVKEAAKLLGLEELLDRKPKALSGGQRQRVAMGRAIVREPKVFLMDEPLSNLDAKLRVSTRTQIAALQRRLGITTVYVTHDQTEAMTMGDRVAVLKDGILQQNDTPLALYDKPNNVFVGGFIGSPAMNLLDGSVTDGHIDVAGGYRIPMETAVKSKIGDEKDLTVGMRPEALRIVGDADSEENGLIVEVAVVEELGADAFMYGLLNGGTESQKEIIARLTDVRHPPEKGKKVKLAADPERIHLFSQATGERVSI